MHFLNHKSNGKDVFISLKLDISKAYDCVEWHFIKHVMENMGFGHDWIIKIMMCINYVSFAVLINGEPSDVIQSS